MEGVKRAFALSFLAVGMCIAVAPLAAFADGLVDINTADSAELQTLSGIGPSKAQAIIDYRTQYGPFAAIEDIQNVSGIGPSTFAKIKDHITVSGSSTAGGTNTAATTTSGASTTTQPQRAVPVSSYVAPPTPSLYADAGGDRTVIVGADVEFDASAYDSESQLVADNVRFSWNFGDGSTAEGASVLHHFSYPGRYVVFLNIAQNKSAGTDEVVVTAEPAALSFEVLPDGGVAIDDRAGHDLDLSGWVIKEAPSPYAPQFTLPPHSVVLASSSIRIPAATLGFKAATSTIVLEYPNGAFALGAGQSTAAARAEADPPPSAASAPTPRPAAHAASARTPRSSVPAASHAPTSTNATSSQVAAAASSSPTSPLLWWLGALALATTAAGGTYAVQHYATRRGHDDTGGEASGWDIVEETPEGGYSSGNER